MRNCEKEKDFVGCLPLLLTVKTPHEQILNSFGGGGVVWRGVNNNKIQN